jgi:hypothetical protein
MKLTTCDWPQLLCRDPIRRLGAGEADAEDIKKHMFFRDVNFDDVYHKRIPPMYFPQIVSRTAFRDRSGADRCILLLRATRPMSLVSHIRRRTA